MIVTVISLNLPTNLHSLNLNGFSKNFHTVFVLIFLKNSHKFSTIWIFTLCKNCRTVSRGSDVQYYYCWEKHSNRQKSYLKWAFLTRLIQQVVRLARSFHFGGNFWNIFFYIFFCLNCFFFSEKWCLNLRFVSIHWNL